MQPAEKIHSPDTPFCDIACTAAGHFSLHVYAAVFWLINYLRHLHEAAGHDPEEMLDQHPFLAGYFAEMRGRMPPDLTWDEGPGWWAHQICCWERNADVHLPLASLSLGDELTFQHRVAFVLTGLVEEDSRFGTLFATLQEPLYGRRPMLELINRILHANCTENLAVPSTVCRELLANGFLAAGDRSVPHAERTLRVPPLLWDVARGDVRLYGDEPPGLVVYAAGELASLDELIIPESLRHQLRHLPALVAGGQVKTVVLRGASNSQRQEVMGALARALGRAVALLEAATLAEETAAQIGPYCRLTQTFPVFTYELTPGESAPLPALTGYRGPVGVLMGREGGLTGSQLARAVTLTLPKPGYADRLRLWQRALGDHLSEDLDEIAARFHLPGGSIRQAAGVAVTLSELDGRNRVAADDIRRACRTLNRQKLDTLAALIDADGSWERLVVNDGAGDKLQELAMRCRHRERLLHHLGSAFGRSANSGVRALFNGPSGTGKTLAARTLAAELGMDLYRVDLAAVVNKYIGETEKNLHQILTHAEELDVILLLDEGDSLLGNRTDVRSANDRYANLETNFLLQRLEHYQGIVLITTNLGENIDSAFQRRMDVVVNFIPPQEQERWQIWRLHLPDDHGVTPDFLTDVALRCPLTGGQIRNAALHATLLALDGAGEGVRVTDGHLDQALRSEYRKAGASFPLVKPASRTGRPPGMAAFLDAVGS